MLKKDSFYYNFFLYGGKEAQKYKDEYIRNILLQEYMYKFISFNHNEELNMMKIELFKQDMIWASHYKYFDDPTELEVKFNKFKVIRKTGESLENIRYLFDMLREIYDVTCFTYDVTKFMWDNYANNSNGFCICFEVLDTDKFFPIEYVNKGKIDLTKSVIKSMKANKGGNIDHKSSLEVTLLPLVLKDFKYIEEKEIRLLFSPFDDGMGKFKGTVYPNVKDEYHHKGSPIAYDYCNIKAVKIIIGNNCDEKYKRIVLELAEKKKILVDYN